MAFTLNPDLDIAQLAADFQQNRKLRIDNVLTLESAESILFGLREYTAWHLVYSNELGQPVRLTNQELEQISEEELEAINAKLHENATASYQYMYKFHPIIEGMQNGILSENSPLYDIGDFLNGTDFIKFARRLTGTDTLVKVDPQATLYEKGHFLNIHDDMGDQRDMQDSSVRRYAIVLGFTKNWSVNWGGQTNFYNASNIANAESWFPTFNSLTIFEVPALHSVSYVAPFASKGRYSVTGWLRDDPTVHRADIDGEPEKKTGES